ncbi:hypothetical protein J3D54_005541 [Pseudomonas sp. GGS8]|uniref:hypothetical protein n=1 Tax=Pseudomonas sp. GGS8 TaxID=2817892 RepID=UPI00209E5F19|nr:hypothetical protein [Pseudomonas sp. GGS8]MCP1446409.1 hypothetical protein [Pseudomonas sp. GGS8]
MLNLTEGERYFFLKKRALAFDAEGREVFVGLSYEESERFHFLSDPARAFTQSEIEEFQRLDGLHKRAKQDSPTSAPESISKKVKVTVGHGAYALDVPSMQSMPPKDYLSYIENELFHFHHHGELHAVLGGYPVATTSDQVKSLISYLNKVAERMKNAGS